MEKQSKLSCHANWGASTVSCSGMCTFWTCWYNPAVSLSGVLVAPAAPSVASGRWVLCWPGFSAVCRVPIWDKGAFPNGEERCWGWYYSVPAAETLFLFFSAFFHLFPWNFNSKWLRCEPFTVIISFFFTLQFTLPVSIRRKRDAVSVWKVDREMVPFALWVKRYYLAQCMWKR